MSTACRRLKSPQSLFGTSAHPTMVTLVNIMVMNGWLTSFSFHVNRPSHSWDKAISDSDLEISTPRSRSFKHFIHMQYFLLLTNLAIVFVHWVSTGVLCKHQQCSLFWDYIPESKLCVCGGMKAIQRWFKVTRELCHEWFHHVRHHVYDAPGLENSRQSFNVYTISQSRSVGTSAENPPKRTSLSQQENVAMGTWPIYKNYYTRLVRKMAWYKILTQVLIV